MNRPRKKYIVWAVPGSDWTGQAGLSVTEVLIGAGIIGIVLAGFTQIFGNAFSINRTLKEKTDLSAIGSYYLSFIDCDKTRADAGYLSACATGQPINLRDKNNNIVLPASGRKFESYLNVTNKCNSGSILLQAYTDKNPTVIKNLVSGVGFDCSIPPPVCQMMTA